MSRPGADREHGSAGLQPTWWHDDHPCAGTIADLAPADPVVDRLAGGLAAGGVGHGDAVVWQMPGSVESARMLWACWRLGAIAVPLHHRATDAEVSRLLSRIGRHTWVEPTDVQSMVERSAPLLGSVASPDDLALVLHTSGSSGAPKAVLHTQAALAHTARTMIRVHGLGPGDAVLMPAPLAHVSGVLNGVTVPAAAGMSSVFMHRWDPERALELVESHAVTFMVGPPTFFVSMLDAPGFSPERVRSLRLVSVGGAGVGADFCSDASERLGAVVKRSYGSTEAPTVATSRVGDDPLRGWHSDGRATPGAALRVDTDGQLHVRGPGCFVGYADPDDGAGAISEDGWFRTGDLARLDDGWLTVTGRLGATIIRGGENVDASEVEAVLAAHPAVRQVVVVGEGDRQLGERIRAVVAPGGSGQVGLEDLRRWCSERGLSRFKWPESLVVVDDLPLLPSGKVDRAALARPDLR